MSAKKSKAKRKRGREEGSIEALSRCYVEAQRKVALARESKRPRHPELRRQLAEFIWEMRSLPELQPDPEKQKLGKVFARQSIAEMRAKVIEIDTRLTEEIAQGAQKWLDDLHSRILADAAPERGVQ